MAENNMGRDRDLVLAPGEFAFVLDTTKGLVNTVVGSHKISMSNTDQTVRWDKNARRIVRCEPEAAIQTDTIAPEGFYIALYNPADEKDGAFMTPREGSSSVSIALKVGHRVNIPGPAHFPLWPGQMASVIQGHHLRSNQYLLAQVYNDAEATANWSKAVLKSAAPTGGDKTTATAPLVQPQSFTPGQLIIIKGTDVAFFIPPTGIKVVPETPKGKNFVREAVTLERLEYCILLDEDGNKRFVKGPDVVFPEPTEQFIVKDDKRKFLAIELNATTGLYVKVIAEYEDESGVHKIGDELFITGTEQAIYFQREEHSVIRYGDQTKHYAVAVPAGEGRYVLNRISGVISLFRGPRMLLCDPRYEVIVRRVLAEKTVRLWYPDNERVVEVNKALEALKKSDDPTSYAGRTPMAASASALMNYSTDSLKSRQIAGDTFTRGQTFTPPRTITLDTKYEGAVSISVWTGYAVLVIDKTGHRRVVVGPEAFLLEYDETLAPLELSTGTPKTDTNLLRTVYLRVHNNKVSDLVRVETKDLVQVNLTVSYRVNFIGDKPEQWFEVENYVRLLCDHMRSLIRNTAKRKNIEEFYANTIDIIRDAVLARPVGDETGRPGRLFVENQMHVYDLEVLDVSIDNPDVAGMLLDAQHDALESAVNLSKQERALLVTQRMEEIKRETAQALSTTSLATHALTQEEINAQLTVNMNRLNAEAAITAARLTKQTEDQTLLNTLNDAEIARATALDAQQLARKTAEIELVLRQVQTETEEIVKRADAVDDNLAIALTTFSDQSLIEKISIALAPMASMSGVSAVDVLAQLFRGTPMEGVMKTLGTRTRMTIPAKP